MHLEDFGYVIGALVVAAALYVVSTTTVWCGRGI